MRRTERYQVNGSNSLWQLYQTVSFWKVLRNVLVAWIARYVPVFSWKNALYRQFLGMEIGEKTAFAFYVMVDLLFPEKIRVGKNSIIGYNTTILTHEYLIDEYRVGEVVIGDEVMIGANTTILPGIRIGDRAVIGAGSVVTKDVPAGAFVAGNPIQVIQQRETSQM
ncbi:acyltransferase [Risungbinella massiliensis]|uniref:acyltransferase n=1 Tax=Risungbinella massiliensis TaxID=1329796 RepID=UPI0005CC70AA|nr:acyltransferase [Risungbinella massiliensis]